MYFQLKVNKSERCHNLGPGRILRGIFAATAHLGARFSCYFHILFTSRTFVYIVEALCLWKDLCSWKNQKRKKVLGKMKKKRGRKRKKEYRSVKRRKKIFVKATSSSGASRWRPDFEQRIRRQTKICHT